MRAIILSETAYLAAMITPAQIRAARAMLGWTQSNLSRESGISEITVKNIERGATDPRVSTMQAIQDAFARADLEFLDPGQSSPDGGMGIRFRGR